MHSMFFVRKLKQFGLWGQIKRMGKLPSLWSLMFPNKEKEVMSRQIK
jgi:hypothetical protein